MKRIKYGVTLATLWRHRNGTYYARWQDHQKNRRKSLGTKEINVAKKRFRNFQRDLIAGKHNFTDPNTKKLLFEFVDEFLEHIEGTKEHSTYVLYNVALEKAKTSWGNIPLNHITMRHIDNLVGDMKKDGLAVPTVNKNYRHIKAALAKALEWKYLKEKIYFPSPLKEEEVIRYLEKDQLRKLFSVIGDEEFADFCLFSAYTGLRLSEILRLKLKDIDNPDGHMRITSKQKNKSESRIPINKTARIIIERCLARRKEAQSLFRFNSRYYISQLFRHYSRKAGLKCRFHDLRHSFASHLAMAGEELKVIQELMRHKSIASTLVYTKLSPEHLKEASDKLDYEL